MNKKWKKIWLAALRGGNFKQGFGRLRNTDNHCCCLGVLADLMGAKWRPGEQQWSCNLQKLGTNYLNNETLSEAGLTYENQRNLSSMNDDGKSFNKIANYIAKNL